MAARERETPQEVMEEQYFGFARLSDEELQEIEERQTREAARIARRVAAANTHTVVGGNKKGKK